MEPETKPQTPSEAEVTEITPFEFASWDDALAWLHSQNPNMENNHPEDLDWQAIKAAARRY